MKGKIGDLLVTVRSYDRTKPYLWKNYWLDEIILNIEPGAMCFVQYYVKSAQVYFVVCNGVVGYINSHYVEKIT
jgi:hypothetical protein